MMITTALLQRPLHSRPRKLAAKVDAASSKKSDFDAITTSAASSSSSPSSSAAMTWPPFLKGQTEKPVRVVVIDDDPRMVNIICNELLADGRTDVVGSAVSLREGRRLITSCEFDVMLVDLNLGDGEGFELIALMKSVHNLAEAIVISAMEDEKHAIHAFELGATGYLIKNSWFGNFVQAVLQVVNGGAYITPRLARGLLSKLQRSPQDVQASQLPMEQPLSKREHEVLKLVCIGHTSAEIASKLLISVLTVNTHIKSMYRKLHVNSRAHAICSANAKGLI